MADFGTIRWSPPESGKHLGTLPIRIRNREGTLIVEGVSGRDIDVPEGMYYVGALLPDGFEVLADEPVRVTAGALAEPVLEGFDKELAATAAPMAGDAAPGAAPIAAQRWRGDWLAQVAKGGELPKSGFDGEAVALGADQPAILQRSFGQDDLLIIEQGGKRSIHVLPLDECVACVGGEAEARSIAVRAVAATDGVNLHFSSPISEDTNAFLQFVDHGLLAESKAISSDLVQRGEQAMIEAQASLLRAVMGAYVLLRANEVEGLDRWIQQLVAAAPDMPDAYALQAETLARLGEHDGAVDALRRGLDKPCPWFRSGVSYTLERLRLYIDVHREPSARFLLSERDLHRFVERKKALERAATRIDTGKVFSTFMA